MNLDKFRLWAAKRGGKRSTKAKFKLWLRELQKFHGRLISREWKMRRDQLRSPTPALVLHRRRRKKRNRMAMLSKRRNRR